VGGAACALARYVQATRPGSDQRVFEPDLELTRRVFERLPLASGSAIAIDGRDGRAGLDSLAPDSVDVVIVDALADGRVPADLTSVELATDAGRVLRATGVLVIDVVSAPDHDYARRVAATVRSRLPHVVAIGFPTILRGLRFGNLVVAGSRAPLPVEQVGKAALALDKPQLVVSGPDLDDWIDDAECLSDAEALASPTPPRAVYRPRT
jgi:spermidine synthase